MSTNSAIIKFLEGIYRSFNDKMHTISIFLDFKNAFDTVNHEILLSKLNKYGIRGRVNDWFRNYLLNRKQRVRIRNSFSECRNIRIGLPQGSALSPILFLIYINDLPSVSNKLSSILFADDATLSLSDKNFGNLVENLNSELGKIDVWTKCNRLTVNYEKTVGIIFSKRPYNLDSNIMMNGRNISTNFEHKYLGVVID